MRHLLLQKNAKKTLSTEKYVTSSSVIIVAKGLENVYKELLKRDFHVQTRSVLVKINEGTAARLGNVDKSNTISIASFLDPRFKDIIFNPSAKQSVNRMLINMVADAINSNERNVGTSSSPAEKPLGDVLTACDHFYAEESKFKPCRTSESKAIIEVPRYLHDNLLPTNEVPMQ
ncbi:hypothetical protein PR048_029726 [Dryococelus australis]|uniref:Uncharacterized protein n=1 Tax=Dryococelus australis TaxID=614101 RepID=A0ABQ9GG06_9NEOP|nr:hypothetical protein PR048_029726 [Dryococelus australis]